MNDEDINEAVFAVTVATIKDYCATRDSQGATREQVNEKLKQFVPAINIWSRRQRGLLKLLFSTHRSLFCFSVA